MWLLILVVLFFIFLFYYNPPKLEVFDFARIHTASPVEIVTPIDIVELQKLFKNNYSSANPYKISIAGSKYSHGGHTMLDNAIYISTKNLNKIEVYPDDKYIKVQSGATWYQIQCALDKHDLSVAEMQSYRNFTVGGSISVNCHGRGMKYGTISDTILELELMKSNGDIIIASNDINFNIFNTLSIITY